MMTLRVTRTAGDERGSRREAWDDVVRRAVETAGAQIALPFAVTITTTTEITLRAELERVGETDFFSRKYPAAPGDVSTPEMNEPEMTNPGLALRLVADWGVAYIPIRNITSIEIEF